MKIDKSAMFCQSPLIVRLTVLSFEDNYKTLKQCYFSLFYGFISHKYKTV